MQYGEVPGVGKPVSRLVHGTIDINLPRLEEGCAVLDAVLEQGCNTFDTAHVYGGGENERAVGHWINDRGIREEVVLLDKGAHHNQDRRRLTPFDIAADLHDSLARLRTDYIDLYVLHRDDPDVPVGPIVEALNEHRDAGLIRAFGGSNWSHERIAQANEYAESHGLTPFALSSPNFSLAEQVEEPWGGCASISGPEGVAAREWYARTQLPVFAWSSLARGFFSGRFSRSNFEELKDGIDPVCVRAYCYEQNFQRLDRVEALARHRGVAVAEIAMAFVMNQPLNIFALVGCRSGEEMASCVTACDLELSEPEMAWLDLRADEPPAGVDWAA